MAEPSFRPLYSSSRAVIIGINNYKSASPLTHAVNDATSLATILRDKFAFPAENIHILLNEAANLTLSNLTRSELLELLQSLDALLRSEFSLSEGEIKNHVEGFLGTLDTSRYLLSLA